MRTIINRGLVDQSINSGLNIRAREDSNLTDEADGKHIVRKLCASQKYHEFDYFLTFTANMSEHFGLSSIKQWLDSGDWIENFPDFHELLPHDQEELVDGMNQAAMGLFTRNWMEVKKLFLLYLYNSDSSPYPCSDCIFARDEYQPDTGNLSHMHLMQGINKAKLTQEQKDKLDDLIRCSIFDIVRTEEVQGLIDEGIMKSIDELPEFHELCSNILSHICKPRCLRRIGPGNNEEDFQCRKTNNLKVSPDNTSHCFMKLPVNYSQRLC